MSGAGALMAALFANGLAYVAWSESESSRGTLGAIVPVVFGGAGLFIWMLGVAAGVDATIRGGRSRTCAIIAFVLLLPPPVISFLAWRILNAPGPRSG